MRRLAFVASIIGAIMSMDSSGAAAASPEDTLYMDLKSGRVVIELRSDLAPKHVARIKELTREGFYDGIVFHRVIEGFMAQTGDVQYGDMQDGFEAGLAGTGGSSLGDLPAEFTDEPFVRGTVGMARAQDPNSANSQFFIMFAPAPPLDGNYTVVGTVESGMEFVDGIKRGDPAQNGMVQEPDRIISPRIAAD